MPVLVDIHYIHMLWLTHKLLAEEDQQFRTVFIKCGGSENKNISHVSVPAYGLLTL